MPPPDKGKGKGEKINAQFSSMPATECIGAGRLDGWFSTPAYICEGRGWGHIRSYCFEGDLFFHLQRSPLLRMVNFQKKDPVTFEVIEFNGQVEAVKLLLPRQVTDLETGAKDSQGEDTGKPEPRDLAGQRIEGQVKSQWQLVEKQSWGFCGSEHFAGQVFWHITDSPGMDGIKFEREDLVEFEITIDPSRGNEVRAKKMVYLGQGRRTYLGPKRLSEKKLAKKEQWKRNWRKGHPPDWECKNCLFSNFGRNKICRKCEIGQRPPREEWPEEEDDFDDNTAAHMQPGDWRCPKCNDIQFSNRDRCRACGTERPPFQDLAAILNLPQRTERDAYKAPPDLQKDDWRGDRSYQANGPGHGPGESAYEKNPQQAKVAETLFGKFSPDENVQAQLALCMGAFNDLVQATVPDGDNSAVIEKVQGLVAEVNGVLSEDKSAKHAFAMQIAKHPWFRENGQEVRYKPSQNLIEVSKLQGHSLKGKGKDKGKGDGKKGDRYFEDVKSHPDPPAGPGHVVRGSIFGAAREAARESGRGESGRGDSGRGGSSWTPSWASNSRSGPY